MLTELLGENRLEYSLNPWTAGRFVLPGGSWASLSMCLCKWVGSQVGVDSFWVGQGELLEGLFPVGGHRSLHEPALGLAFAGG